MTIPLLLHPKITCIINIVMQGKHTVTMWEKERGWGMVGGYVGWGMVRGYVELVMGMAECYGGCGMVGGYGGCGMVGGYGG